jgi:hypothetical protein
MDQDEEFMPKTHPNHDNATWQVNAVATSSASSQKDLVPTKKRYWIRIGQDLFFPTELSNRSATFSFLAKSFFCLAVANIRQTLSIGFCHRDEDNTSTHPTFI